MKGAIAVACVVSIHTVISSHTMCATVCSIVILLTYHSKSHSEANTMDSSVLFHLCETVVHLQCSVYDYVIQAIIIYWVSISSFDIQLKLYLYMHNITILSL